MRSTYFYWVDHYFCSFSLVKAKKYTFKKIFKVRRKADTFFFFFK
jgi:hypothetical protein